MTLYPLWGEMAKETPAVPSHLYLGFGEPNGLHCAREFYTHPRPILPGGPPATDFEIRALDRLR